MAQQAAITLGVFGLIQGRRFWNGTPRPLVDAGLVFAAGTAHLALIQHFSSDRVLVRLAATQTEMSSDAGPEFTDALETSAVAITLESAGLGSITIPGPNHPDSIISDPSEPYLWQPSNGAAMTTWFESLTDTSTVVLTLDDGVAASRYTAAAGEPSSIATGHVTWQDRSPPVGLADVSGLSSDSDPRYILRLRLWRDGRVNPIYLNAIRATPDGLNAFGQGDDLNTDWEGSAVALTLSAPNGDLVIVGPQHPDAGASDASEPYSWAGSDLAALDAWVAAYLALDATDRALFSFTLDDDTGSTGHRVDADGVAWSFAVAEPTVTHIPRVPVAHAVDAEGASWAFAVAEPTVTHTLASTATAHRVDAGGATWSFAVAEPTVTHTRRAAVSHRVAAGGASWAFAVSEPTVRHGSDFPAPRFLVAVVPGGLAVDLSWSPPSGAGADRYRVVVVDPDGTAQAAEDTDGPALGWRIRGLAIGHRYGFRVHAVSAANRISVASETVYAVPVRSGRTTAPPPGQPIPLNDVDRQSLIVRLAGRDCRIRVWWQPSDASWWASLEVPANTPAIQSRRLALNSGILDRVTGVLPGNLVCRSLGGIGTDPARDAWREPTHALVWEPA